jgi:uncharacterized membrane protein YqjE
MEDTVESQLEQAYLILHFILLGLMSLVFLLLVAIKLRFRLDKVAMLIVVT